MADDKRIPVRILTGFLGSGKTTLVNHILTQDHGLGRIGVVENEYGEASIDGRTVKSHMFDDQQVIEVSNGCLCCNVRGDLKRAVLEMGAQQPPIDSIIIEASGVAAPGPIVQTFLGDLEVASKFCLMGVITVVDALHLPQQLKAAPQVPAQIAFADMILINKIDLITPADLKDVKATLQTMNAHAELVETHKCRVTPLRRILETKPFGQERFDTIVDADANAAGAEHQQTDGIQTFTVRVEAVMNLAAVELWLSRLVMEQGDGLYRYKGIMEVKPREGERYLFQGVHQIFGGEIIPGGWAAEEARDGGKRACTMVFIGRDLDKAAIEASLAACAAPAALRFPVGAPVECSTPCGYQAGCVLEHWSVGSPYLVDIHSNIPGIPGRRVYAPVDDDTFIRAAPCTAAA